MAGKHKGTTTGRKSAASTMDGGTSNLLLDASPVQPQTPENDIAKETQRLDTQVTKCKVGVAWINILDMQDRLKFGTYNDRPPNDTEINKLIVSFKTSGIVAMKDVSAIPIIIDVKRIKTGLTLATGFDEPDDVPELELLDEQDITVASGQHRLAALCKYHQSIKDELASLEKKRARMASLKHPSEEQVVMYEDLRYEVGRILGRLGGIGKWGVVVYDSNKLLAKDEKLATHLSRNNTLHDFKETEEEVLVSVLKGIQAIFKKSPVHKQADLAMIELQEARKKNAKNARLQKVLHHDRLCILLATHLLQLGPQIRCRQEFSVTWLAKSLDVCMGLYVLWIESRCKTLMRLSSHAPFPSYAEVRNLLEKSEKGDEEAKEKLNGLRTSIATCKPADEGDLSIWANVIDKVNSHASAFNDNTDIMEQMSPLYIEMLSTYRASTIRTLRHAWLGNHHNAADGGDEHMKHLDSIIARVALHLTPSEDAERAPEPLLGGFMMDYAWKYLTSVKAGIAEICRWFEALLDYWRFLHGKTHTMDDWSTVMLSNIAKDPRFEEEGSDIEVMQIIWDYRQTLVMHLNNAIIKRMRRTDNRPKDKKAFLAAIKQFDDSEQSASKALQQIVLKRRGKYAVSNRDISNESLSIPGTLALHVTAWEWHSLSIKNIARDMQPCINAIILEHALILQYRIKLFRDKLVGCLRRIIELSLSKRLQPKQKMTSRKELYTVQHWIWWDGLTLSDFLADPMKVLKEIHEDIFQKQHTQQERLALENLDRAAIQKLVNSVANMSCAKAFRTPQSNMSSEVFMALTQLVDALELNSTRLRTRAIANDNELQFDSSNIINLHIQLPNWSQDDNTLAAEVHDEDDSDVIEAVISPGKRTTPHDTDNRQRAVSLDNPNMQLTPRDTAHSIPKARPIPRKRRQRSPVPDDTADSIDEHNDSSHSAAASSTSTPYEAALDAHDLPAHSDSDGETTQMIIDDTSHSPSSEYQAYNHATGVALTWSSELGHNDIDAADNSIDIGTESEETHTAADGTVPFGDPDSYNAHRGDLSDGCVPDDTHTTSNKECTTTTRFMQKSSALPSQRSAQPLSVVATATATTKRARAATGSSKAPSSPARGKKSMKKARIQVNEPTEDDEDECTFVPGV